MEINGIDLEGLAHEASALIIPDMVKGRTVHIDADFLAYQMTFEKPEDPKTWEDMKHNCEVAVRLLKSLAGAEFLHLHLTPGTSDKGDRFDIAIQKQYQGNRIEKPKPRYLHIMREWMAQNFPATMHQHCEADDGMSSAQYASLAMDQRLLSIIASKDKDLSMVPGLHLDWDTGAITDSETDFGSIDLVVKKSSGGTVTKQIKGFGQSYFWAQMLTGDPADHIQGLPKVPGAVLNAVKPTAETIKYKTILDDPTQPEPKKAKARAKLAERAPGLCGAVIAFEMLQRVKNNKQAFGFVKAMYEAVGQAVGFKHWQTGEDVPWQKVFVSEAQLLWMRRDKHNPLCVAQWWKEVLH